MVIVSDAEGELHDITHRLSRGDLVRMEAERVDSNIIYQIGVKRMQSGTCVPKQIGEGRFAKVYKARQCSDGQEIRVVAIKVLHNTARYVDQNLFEQEIELLKALSKASQSNVVNILDVVHLGPMIMCGCGRIYHPLCPDCGRHQLQRRDVDNKEYPSLACPDMHCGYEVSAMNIEMQYKRLTGPMAKPCCKEGPRAQEGTIINFVDRPAVVMELQEVRLDAVASHRQKFFQQSCQQFFSAASSSGRHSSRNRLRLQRAMALDKMMLMVQVAESVAWLHQAMEIIHKDLTPDNVMVNFGNNHLEKSHWQNRKPADLQELLNDLVSYPTFGVKVIDFGLADRKHLSRKWYEEKDIINAGVDKAPYFSPEALQRTQRLNHQLYIDPEQRRFVIPPELRDSNLAVREGDVLAFQWDLDHIHDLTITRIEAGQTPGIFYAYYEGNPPPPEQHRQMLLVLPLGEAHDVYSVGALFYYIMTGGHLQVQHLSSFVSVIQTHPCELTAHALKRRHGDSYLAHRDAIPIPDPYWRDRIMELILRAMVRGRRHSFNRSRSDRGPEPALDLLWETKRIYRGMQEEILAEHRVRRLKTLTLPMAATLTAVLCLIAAWRYERYAQRHHALPAQQCSPPFTSTHSTPPTRPPQFRVEPLL